MEICAKFHHVKGAYGHQDEEFVMKKVERMKSDETKKSRGGG